MHFSKMNIQLNVCLNNTQIEIVDVFKFLGFHIDKNLKWNHQIDFIVKKLSSICCLIQRIRQFLTRKFLLLIFNSLALPHIYYTIINIATQYKTMFSKIKNKFKSCGTVLHN